MASISKSFVLQRVVEALREGNLTVAELAEKSFTAVSTLQSGHYLGQLYRDKVIYVADWKRNPKGGGTIKLWGLCLDGQCEDAPRPKAFTGREKVRRWRRRLTNELGWKLAKKIRNSPKHGGVSTVVVAGQLFYKRGTRDEPGGRTVRKVRDLFVDNDPTGDDD